MDTAKAAGEMENLLLTDLIDIETLRRIQDSFSDVAGVASLITDREGLPSPKGPVSRNSVPDMCRPRRRGRNGANSVTALVRRLLRRAPFAYHCHGAG